jgi:N-acetylglutamate synthase-like GNAT family acetyltransferase
MTRRWIHENPAVWTADKARIVGRAREGIFDGRYAAAKEGEMIPGEWWRVEDDGRTVAFGWMDVVWGDAEILLATDPDEREKGIGSYVLERLADEAHKQGLNYLYNVIRPTHPEPEKLTAFLTKRGFVASDDGRLLRAASRPSAPPAA